MDAILISPADEDTFRALVGQPRESPSAAPGDA
jgi:hypothetical protein